jgi:hypothetical protein
LYVVTVEGLPVGVNCAIHSIRASYPILKIFANVLFVSLIARITNIGKLLFTALGDYWLGSILDYILATVG